MSGRVLRYDKKKRRVYWMVRKEDAMVSERSQLALRFQCLGFFWSLHVVNNPGLWLYKWPGRLPGPKRGHYGPELALGTEQDETLSYPREKFIARSTLIGREIIGHSFLLSSRSKTPLIHDRRIIAIHSKLRTTSFHNSPCSKFYFLFCLFILLSLNILIFFNLHVNLLFLGTRLGFFFFRDGVQDKFLSWLFSFNLRKFTLSVFFPFSHLIINKRFFCSLEILIY